MGKFGSPLEGVLGVLGAAGVLGVLGVFSAFGCRGVLAAGSWHRVQVEFKNMKSLSILIVDKMLDSEVITLGARPEGLRSGRGEKVGN